MGVIKEKINEDDRLNNKNKKRDMFQKSGLHQVSHTQTNKIKMGINQSGQFDHHQRISSDLSHHQFRDIMSEELAQGLTVKDAIGHIQSCLEERDKQKNPSLQI